MNKTVLKIGFGVILILATLHGAAYLFNHVNPWLAVGVYAIGGVCLLSLIVNIIKQQTK